MNKTREVLRGVVLLRACLPRPNYSGAAGWRSLLNFKFSKYFLLSNDLQIGKFNVFPSLRAFDHCITELFLIGLFDFDLFNSRTRLRLR